MINKQPDQVFKTKLKGVTYLNEDGTSRQDLLCGLAAWSTISLERDYNNLYDIYAIKVLNSKGSILGYLDSDLRLAYHMDLECKTTASIVKITGGKSLIDKLFNLKGKNFGCIIEISKSMKWNDTNTRNSQTFNDLSALYKNRIQKADSFKKTDPKTAINLYKEIMDTIINYDDGTFDSRGYLYIKSPISKLTVLLERAKDYDLALYYINWFKNNKRFNSLKQTEQQTLEKRLKRITEKHKKAATH